MQFNVCDFHKVWRKEGRIFLWNSHLILSYESAEYLENKKKRFFYRVLVMVYEIRIHRYFGFFKQIYWNITKPLQFSGTFLVPPFRR